MARARQTTSAVGVEIAAIDLEALRRFGRWWESRAEQHEEQEQPTDSADEQAAA